MNTTIPDDEAFIVTLVTTLAEAKGVAAREIGPLYDDIPIDAISRLVDGERRPLRLTFEACGYWVTVTEGTHLRLVPMNRHG